MLDPFPAPVVNVLRSPPRAVEVVVAGRPLLAQSLHRRLHHRLPGVILLPAHEVPGAKTVVVRRAAVLEVVQMIADKMRVYAGKPHRLRKRIVERLERSPAPMHEIQSAGVQIAARRHAGKAADEMPVEGDGARREAIEIGRAHPRRAVAAQCIAAQRIEQHEYRLHRRPRSGKAVSVGPRRHTVKFYLFNDP